MKVIIIVEIFVIRLVRDTSKGADAMGASPNQIEEILLKGFA